MRTSLKDKSKKKVKKTSLNNNEQHDLNIDMPTKSEVNISEEPVNSTDVTQRASRRKDDRKVQAKMFACALTSLSAGGSGSSMTPEKQSRILTPPSAPAKSSEKQSRILPPPSVPTKAPEKQIKILPLPSVPTKSSEEKQIIRILPLPSVPTKTPEKQNRILPPHSVPTKTPRRQRVLNSSIFISPFFTKAYAFSNHFKCYFYVDDLRFCCTEQFYMYYKAVVFGDTESANEIMEMTEAREMKRIGSNIRLFDTEKWRNISILVMLICNMEKYKQNADLRKLLFETGDTLLVEATSQDLYWGAGVDVDSAAIRDKENWPGKNVLGRILTRIRDVLKSKKEYEHEWEEANRRQTI